MKNISQLYYFRTCQITQLLGAESPDLNLSSNLLANLYQPASAGGRPRPLVLATLRSYMVVVCFLFQSLAEKVPSFESLFLPGPRSPTFTLGPAIDSCLLYWHNQDLIKEFSTSPYREVLHRSAISLGNFFFLAFWDWLSGSWPFTYHILRMVLHWFFCSYPQALRIQTCGSWFLRQGLNMWPRLSLSSQAGLELMILCLCLCLLRTEITGLCLHAALLGAAWYPFIRNEKELLCAEGFLLE